ncbi:hypothetical protein HHK36_009622 [Tetracentron sinense]|uniref:Protein CLT2, chloroplastic n=1 Tax=Tetracentron sinense TaxID=13715 RepID=A0A835DHN4_TETSI|nr:hypothetical protein HHK36_009622 [Tetracentron sinense]
MGFSSLSSIHFTPSQLPRLYNNDINGLSFISMCMPQNPRFCCQASSRTFFNGDSRVFLRKSYIQQKSVRAPNFRVHASSEESLLSTDKSRIFAGSAITVVLAVANRVLYKLALVPMKQYPLFLAQVTTFGYVAIYFSILYVRYGAGIVTEEMLAIPKSRFVAIGILEALGVAAGMSSGAMLPGPAIPILSQTFLVWQLAFSTVILGRKYSFNQIAGCLLVAAGVVAAVASGSDEGQMLSEVEFIWPALMIASSAFQAGASILKEFVFIDAATRLKGKPLDIFVVNSFGSGFQALFVLLFLPIISNSKGVPFTQLPSFLKSGTGCFLNIGANATGKFSHLGIDKITYMILSCDGAPLLPLLFIVINVAFNISLLNLVKISSAVVSSLAATLAVPIAIYVLSLPLPYIPGGASLSPFFLFGSVILVLGLILYNIPQLTNQGTRL